MPVGLNERFQALRGWDAELRSGVADGPHRLLHQGDFFLRRRVNALAGFGIGSDHYRIRLGIALFGQLRPERLPNLLSNERHKGMQQAQDTLQDMGQRRQGRGFAAVANPDLRHLDVPVAVVVPDELVETLLRVAKLEVLQCAVDIGSHPVESADYPAILPVLRSDVAPSFDKLRMS